MTTFLGPEDKPSVQNLAFPLPPLRDSEVYNYPNQSGFRYQIEAVQKCIQQGCMESPEYPHQEMLQNVAILQLAMSEIGYGTTTLHTDDITKAKLWEQQGDCMQSATR